MGTRGRRVFKLGALLRTSTFLKNLHSGHINTCPSYDSFTRMEMPKHLGEVEPQEEDQDEKLAELKKKMLWDDEEI